MRVKLRDGSCFPEVLEAVNISLACVDGVIAVIAFSQLIRIHSRNSQLGWTRQKVFLLMIGSSNMGYFVYFVLTLISACKEWLCWSNSCGFVVMAFPEILFLAVFLLLLSFWVDLCHQADEEDDDDDEWSIREALLAMTLNKPSSSSNSESHRRCCPFRTVHIGSRQKIVLLVVVLLFVLMMVFAVLIWIGMGKNPIDSSFVTKVYAVFFAIAILLLGGALACYGIFLFLKMRKVRSQRASSEMWKVAGLAVVSVLCFTSRAIVALCTDIPVLYVSLPRHVNGVSTSLLLILYYCIGSSIPSAFVLWVMRELPAPRVAINLQAEPRTVTFISGTPASVHHPQSWTATSRAQNQIQRASPI